MQTDTTHPNGITLRLADYGDARALIRVATLDSKRVPDGRLVVAEVGGEIVAAVPMDGGVAIANPFHRTAALVEMLEVRAAQIRRPHAAQPDAGLVERTLSALRPARPQPRLP